MKPELEKYLWDRVRSLSDIAHITPRDVIDGMLSAGLIKSPKQAWRTLEKWSKIGIYEYGVTLDLGWKTPVKQVTL